MTIRFPTEVRGWLTEPEGYKLAELAEGKLVLELGSYCGRSTVCMAQTAASVTSIDWHQGDPQAGFLLGGTEHLFRETLENFGLTDKVEIIVGRMQDEIPKLKSRTFGLVFVDGAHDYDNAVYDIAAAKRMAGAWGTVALHDWNEPEIRRAAFDILEWSEAPNRVGNLAWGPARVRERVSDKCEKPLVAITMPRRGALACYDSVLSQVLPATKNCTVGFVSSPRGSILDNTFNDCWVGAWNAKRRGLNISYFAMIHDDIQPQSWWLDVLIEELETRGADMVAGVPAIKSTYGLTSTAFIPAEFGSDVWVHRRLTMKELHELPETFGADDVGGQLLLNTGLWVCDFRKPWIDDVCFDSLKRVRTLQSGERVCEAISEDWLFSHFLNERGAKIYGTRKVGIRHNGDSDFPNDHVWGEWDTDNIFWSGLGQEPRPIGEAACSASP